MPTTRPVEADFLHNMRFHVDVVNDQGADYLTGDGTQAGFSSCTTPELTVAVAEYKEGQDLYTEKYPGLATWNDLTMMRGVTKFNTAFYDWTRNVAEGNQSYRATIKIKHFHRQDSQYATDEFGAGVLKRTGDIPAKIYECYNAFPTRCKFGSDLAGNDGEVSVSEVDVAYEWAALLPVPPAP